MPIETVDHTIVDQLHHHYAPERITACPLRPELDFIARTPEGEWLASADVPTLIERLKAIDIDAHEGGSYVLHPATMGARWSARFPAQVTCFEVRRDLLTHWEPFVEKRLRVERIDAIADAMVQGLMGDFRSAG